MAAFSAPSSFRRYDALAILAWLVLAVLMLAAWVFHLTPAALDPASHTTPLCFFQAATGWPCPFCGLTRSMLAAMHGDWPESFAYHWLGIPTLLLTILYAALSVTAPSVTMRLRRMFAGRAWLTFVLALLTLGWFWKIYRLGPG